jgi:hypothetical protein
MNADGTPSVGPLPSEADLKASRDAKAQAAKDLYNTFIQPIDEATDPRNTTYATVKKSIPVVAELVTLKGAGRGVGALDNVPNVPDIPNPLGLVRALLLALVAGLRRRRLRTLARAAALGRV